MGRAANFVAFIESFKEWDIGGSKTQSTSSIAEDFIEKAIMKIYPDSIAIKLGSQQHPDFIVAPKDVASSLEFKARSMGKRKTTRKVIEDWEKSALNKGNLRLARVEVKTGENVYTLNDTFPEPSKSIDEIYILFSIGEKKIFVTTSATLAEACRRHPPIKERLLASKETVSEFQSRLKKIWEGTGISTAARPTYRMNKEYAHVKAKAESIKEIFEKAGFKD